MNIRTTPTLLTALTIIATPAAAQAQSLIDTFYLNVFGGANVVLDDWDLHQFGDRGISPCTSPLLGLRLGADLGRWISLEGGLGILPFTSEDTGSNLALQYGLNLGIRPFKGDWIPMLLIGGGGYNNVDGSHGNDLDYYLDYGIAVRGKVTDWLRLRAEARHVFTDGHEHNSTLANNIEITAGVELLIWVASDSEGSDRFVVGGPNEDADHDGINDEIDECPQQPGSIRNAGCPGEPPTASVVRRASACDPAAGCIDDDGDGVGNDEDACPDQVGSPTALGCPDADEDGVKDDDDACPDQYGPRAVGGCPDKDGDLVANMKDDCPDQAGPESNHGCPLDMSSGMTGTAGAGVDNVGGRRRIARAPTEGYPVVYFGSAKSALDLNARSVLEWIKAQFETSDTMRISVQGHADERGEDNTNLALAQARADAVRNWLIKNGVDAGRIKAEGFGETRPRADNKTDAGRAQNRRVEFVVDAP